MAVEAGELRRRMVDEVMADDFVTAWRAAVMPWRPSLLAVPRHEFLPDMVWVCNADGGSPAGCGAGHQCRDRPRYRHPRQKSAVGHRVQGGDCDHSSTVTGPHGARIAIGQQVPGCQWRYWPWATSEPVGVLWLVDPWGSWAKLTHTSPHADENEFPVLQSGPRWLWDEVESACRWWRDAGSPGADRWWFTVTPHGQRVQLS